MLKKTIFLLIFIVSQSIVFGQSTFQFLLESPIRKVSEMAIDDGSGGIVVPISETSGIDYGSGDFIKGYLLNINAMGDTVTYRYSFHDTTFRLQRIHRLDGEGYMIFGSSRPPGTQDTHLMICGLDNDFNLLWAKHYPYSNLNFAVSIKEIFVDADTLILAGARCAYPCTWPFPFLLKIDLAGNILHEVLHENPDLPGYIDAYMYCQSAKRIWMFVKDFVTGISGPARCVFGSDFELLYCESVPANDRPWRITNSWTPDSLILMAYISDRPGAQYQDDEIWLAKYDTALNLIARNSFGRADTLDNTPFVGAGAACLHPDTVYFAGYKHKTLWQPTPNIRNWILAGQTDGQLQPRFLHYIGGDAYYETKYMLATSDGGFVILAGVFNQQTLVYDFLFLKLNKEGLITNSKPNDVPIKRAYISPNPASEFLKVECMFQGAEARVLSLTGIELSNFNLEQGTTVFPLHDIKPGMYLLNIVLPGKGVIETHKFIKL